MTVNKVRTNQNAFATGGTDDERSLDGVCVPPVAI